MSSTTTRYRSSGSSSSRRGSPSSSSSGSSSSGSSSSGSSGGSSSSDSSSSGSSSGGKPATTQSERERAREANRIHCKETRDRRRERERRLGEEVEILKLCKSIVEDGPDLFSLHKPSMDAPFSYLCDNFFSRLQMRPEEMLGRPLSSIVDERDQAPFRSAIFQVLEQASRRPPSADDGGSENGGGDFTGGSTGSLIHLRVTHGQISCEASMSIVCGSHGLIVVTRLYNW